MKALMSQGQQRPVLEKSANGRRFMRFNHVTGGLRFYRADAVDPLIFCPVESYFAGPASQVSSTKPASAVSEGHEDRQAQSRRRRRSQDGILMETR